MFKVVIDDQSVEISGDKENASVENLMLNLVMITRSIYDMKHLSSAEKDIFRGFVEDLLPKIAFMTAEEVEQLKTELERKNQEAKEELNKQIKEIKKLLDEFLEEET